MKSFDELFRMLPREGLLYEVKHSGQEHTPLHTIWLGSDGGNDKKLVAFVGGVFAPYWSFNCNREEAYEAMKEACKTKLQRDIDRAEEKMEEFRMIVGDDQKG